MSKAIKFFSIVFLSIQVTSVFSSGIYNYLCGSDEDGCDPNRPDTCICIASNPEDLDICFTYESCVPVDAITKKCAHDQMNEKTEARCLATLWQSEPTPPCVHLYVPPTPDICMLRCTSLENCEPTR